MKANYEYPILTVTRIDENDIVRTSPGGWKEGDNDLNWGDNAWSDGDGE